MEYKEQGNNTFISVIVGVAVLLLIIFVASNKQSQSDCNDRAEQAAIETYDMQNYPDTAERGRLQAVYKQTYMESCQ